MVTAVPPMLSAVEWAGVCLGSGSNRKPAPRSLDKARVTAYDQLDELGMMGECSP